MCGICGELSLSDRPVDAPAIDSMLEALVHRGPDAGGTYEAPGVVAGIRRLAVIDVEGGNQPIANEDGSVEVVFNGEIYNYREIREQLVARGHRFKTHSDTEVLVHLWEDDGPEMVRRLNGMFAFCIHDRGKRETFIARDRLGIKPLFYHREGDRLVFASELRALLEHPAVDAAVDQAALIELLCLQYPAGEGTVYRGIRKLLPGHAIRVRGGDVSIDRYWELPAADPAADADAGKLQQELAEILDSSVRYRRICDVPLGVFLSGGLDSSAVLGVLSAVVDRPVTTFSVGFDSEAAFDERAHARRAAEHFGADHHELVVSPVQIAEHLERLVGHLAEPVTDPALIPTYLLSEFAHQRVTVVLTGEGADELFGGYRRHQYQQRYGWISKVPGAGLAATDAVERLLPRRIGQALDAVVEREPAWNYLQWASTIGRSDAMRLFDDDAYSRYAEGIVARFRAYFSGPDIRLGEQLRADQGEWLPHNLLAKVDRASMAFSLEARVPFLDHRLVEWAARVPDRFKIDGAATKVVLRETFRERLPKSILQRPKRGFDLPLASWIRGPLRPLVTELLTPENLRLWEGLRSEAVVDMLELHLAEKQDYGLPLFNILSVMLFLRGHA